MLLIRTTDRQVFRVEWTPAFSANARQEWGLRRNGFRVCRQQTLPWDCFRVARDSGRICSWDLQYL